MGDARGRQRGEVAFYVWRLLRMQTKCVQKRRIWTEACV